MIEKEPQFHKAETKKEDPVNELREFLKLNALELKKKGFPVLESGRIDIDGFRGIHSPHTIEADGRYVKDKKEIFWRDKRQEADKLLPGTREKFLREVSQGEIFEMLITVVLQKNLGEKFIVLRSSDYDDIKNGADTIILDKTTGSIVCALDEVGDTKGKSYEEKKSLTLAKNREGGGMLKYGLYFSKTKEGTVEKGFLTRIPLFYCASPKELIQDAIKTFGPGGVCSAAENELFANFLKFSRDQVEALKKERLDPTLRERLELFEQSVLK